jgi:hypothetical protein
MPRPSASETIDLSTLWTHAPFTFARAFRTCYLRLAIWCWAPLLIPVHHDVLYLV